MVNHRQGRPPTWQEHRAAADAARRTPQALHALAERIVEVGTEAGLAAVGITTAEPLLGAREQINRRVAAGQHAGMVFTFTRPEKATTPARLIPEAASVIVGAWPYSFAHPTSRSDGGPFRVPGNEGLHRPPEPQRAYEGRVARYQWVDHYAALRGTLKLIATELKAAGWRARVLADDNALVDRAAAHRAGVGWFGKNANILIPGHGSWFVLGSVVTDAPLNAASEPVPDGCGSCTRCIPGCPTGAIVEPGVIDARRCLAWLVQAPGEFPIEFRVALHDRIYGCDDCQEVCPENRVAARREAPRVPPHDSVAVVDLVWLATASDDAILERFGRWWLPNRDPDVLRRNAVIALGNTGDPGDQTLLALLDEIAGGSRSALLQTHAKWAIDRLAERARVGSQTGLGRGHR